MDKYKKADKLLEDNQVLIDVDTGKSIWFVVRNLYYTRYDKHLDNWSCTCMSYIFNPTLECSHVIAAKEYLNKKGGSDDTNG